MSATRLRARILVSATHFTIGLSVTDDGRYFTLDHDNLLTWIKAEEALAVWSDAKESLRVPDDVSEIMRLMYEVKYPVKGGAP